MKLKRVANSCQNVTSATAPNSSAATTSQEADPAQRVLARVPRQRSGSSADDSSHGAIAQASVARSKPRPRTNRPGAWAHPACAGPVAIQRATRSSVQTTSANTPATAAKRAIGGEGGGVPGMVAGIIVAHAVFAMGVARTGWEPHYPLSIACASAA